VRSRPNLAHPSDDSSYLVIAQLREVTIRP
jgi:hypothetical protein